LINAILRRSRTLKGKQNSRRSRIGDKLPAL
jgi:hypothetical protein